MNQDIEKQINQLNYKLRSLSQEQSQNQRAIQKIEQTEADFHEWKGRSHRLFDHIFETWHNDRELRQFFYNTQQDARQLERQLTYELEDRKETLLKEKENLNDLENDLYYQKQNLAREVKP
ncbi:DUF3958 family protein [Bacillus sp. NPDC077411]|uniref:DUF3958 family protein n=1 Tax=Bacillus sp. NPDC077411 TaxID=3363947 RepID=UPI0037C97CB8